MAKVDGLTEKERRFVEAYMGPAAGNATEAAATAGYRSKSRPGLAALASDLLRKPDIAKAILDRQKSDPLVADRKERQEFWTAVLRGEADGNFDTKDRLRASELLGKASGDFLERIANPDGSALKFVIPFLNRRDNLPNDAGDGE